MFVGRHQISLDEKNRFLVPSRVRKAMPENEQTDNWYLVPGQSEGRLELYPQRHFEELARQVPSSIVPDDEVADLDEVFWSMVDLVDMDKQGRILVPDEKIRKAGLGKELMLVGARDHLIIVDRERYMSEISEKESRVQDIRKRVKGKLREQATVTQ